MITYKTYSTKSSYKCKEGKNSDSVISKTILEAKLRFNLETKQMDDENDRLFVKFRIFGRKFGEKAGMLSEYPLEGFLYHKERIIYNELTGKYQDCDLLKERKVSIKKRRDLGIDIKISSKKALKDEEMLNLGSLHEFIITGK